MAGATAWQSERRFSDGRDLRNRSVRAHGHLAALGKPVEDITNCRDRITLDRVFVGHVFGARAGVLNRVACRTRGHVRCSIVYPWRIIS
jgi:hypothetical protein